LKFPKNPKILIEGISGIGKSTLIDIILGLLKLDKGNLLVDGKKIDKKNFISWNKNISYLTQETFIIEGNFYQNVALDMNINDDVKKKVVDCCKISEIHNFINSKSGKYERMISYSGKDLSNGQKQRLGLARALFKFPSLLILDEATNSIDSINEKKIFHNLKKMNNLTLLHISHKKVTHSIYDNKILIKNKKIYLTKI